MSALHLVPAEMQSAYHDQATDILKFAYQAQGQRALESTKRCAAIHEAGHCVVNTITAGGMFWPPAMTRIWRHPVKGMTVWLGNTEPPKNAPPLRVDAREDVTGYMILAVRTLGGVVAEMLFDGGDYRIGSSVDEWVVAGGCARALADVGAFPSAEAAMHQLLMTTSNMLTANASTVHAIATALQQRRKVEGMELAGLLKSVVMDPLNPDHHHAKEGSSFKAHRQCVIKVITIF